MNVLFILFMIPLLMQSLSEYVPWCGRNLLNFFNTAKVIINVWCIIYALFKAEFYFNWSGAEHASSKEVFDQ